METPSPACYDAAMRYSRAFIPTVKEVPKEATMPSHVLMLRAGYARMVGAGIYELLPLGTRVLHKIERIIRQEMAAIGAQEFHLPGLLPAEPWKESGRWDEIGDDLVGMRTPGGERVRRVIAAPDIGTAPERLGDETCV